MKQRLPLAGTDLVWCCPERPVIHYVLSLSYVILDLILVRYELCVQRIDAKQS